MLRRILFAMGLSNWCKIEGVVRNINSGCSRPFTAPINHTMIEGEDFEVVPN